MKARSSTFQCRSPRKLLDIGMSSYVLALAITTAPALDILVLNDGRRVRGKHLYVADDETKIRVVIEGQRGRGEATQDIPSSDIDFIDFDPLENEQEIMAAPAEAQIADLRKLWLDSQRYLPFPRSRAATVALAYAQRLLSDPAADKSLILPVLTRVEKRAWDPGDQAAARVMRLRTWLATGREKEAVVEAERLAEETEDAALLIEAQHIVATVEFEQLKELEEENPKWEEDDDIRPERERLYHAAIDRFLFPYLFHGSQEEVAARGLKAAAEVYAFAGLKDRAAECTEDIQNLYPETAIASQ